MPTPSFATTLLPHSGIREIMELVLRSSADIARMELGEPDFATPDHIVEAAARSARAGSSYVATPGVPELREAAAGRLQRAYGTCPAVERVLITHGAVQGLDAVMRAVVGPGDEVLVPDPGWPNYAMQAIMAGASPIRYALRPEAGFMPDPEQVRSLITPRTRALVVNSPSNPTGAVFPRELIEELLSIAETHDLTVISDEVYDEIVYDAPHVHLAALAPERVASVFSMSKTYAMTGWRVGYAVVPAHLADPVTRLLETSISCTSSVTQAAALAALTGPQDAVAVMRTTYRERRDLALSLLRERGVDAVAPRGTFYLMMPLPDGTPARDAALELVARGVAFAPGTAFGDEAPHHLRASLAASDDTITIGIERFLAWREEQIARA
ncbi:pyridoxal phosphate-dependent aminotransferase [Demequina sp. NBRC 110054]|uniref:pyridoxal phosphate-dependent aminotransferase n=1 Tax=Demequina sp. NBRC 110054 TaxID=1570343 RepID=UPI0009FD75EB|nr:pyridoxal phosphate-dependent aminotransferase [Demequina sp. NBRC 110054]